jgi:UDP-N-acetylmuramate dehydrogenase
MEAARVMTGPQLRGEMLFNEPMSRHLSWRAGGNAKCYFVPADIEDLSVLLASLPDDEAILWLGLGSNTLVRDGGFNGTVIALQGIMNELERLADDRVYAGAGVTASKLARFCAKQDLVGAEFFAGIPGLVGGALAMNAGAFGGETWRHVISVETIDR